MTPITLVGALIIGVGIGILTGIFGVGGGFLITPLLNIVLGLPMEIAVGTGLLQILGTASAGIYRRRNEGTIDIKLAVVLFGGTTVGSIMGKNLLEHLTTLGDVTLRGGSMPAAQFYMLIVFMVLLSLIAGWVFYDTSRKKDEDDDAPVVGLFSKIKLPPYTEFSSLDEPRMSIPVLAYFGLFLGFMTGLMGIGGGVIMLPALVYLIGMRTHRAAATSLAVVILSAIVSTIGHAAAGNSSILLALPLLVGGSIGVQLGANLSEKMGGRSLQRYFGYVVLAAILVVAFELGAYVF